MAVRRTCIHEPPGVSRPIRGDPVLLLRRGRQTEQQSEARGRVGDEDGMNGP